MNFAGISLYQGGGGGGGGGGVSAGPGISVTGTTVSLNQQSQTSLANVQYITRDTVPSIGRSTAIDSNLAVGLGTYLFGDLSQQRGTDMLPRELPVTVGNNLLCASGESLTLGDRNILYGKQSLPSLTVGDDNVAVGYKVGAGVASGSANAMIGCNIISREPFCTNSCALERACRPRRTQCASAKAARVKSRASWLGKARRPMAPAVSLLGAWRRVWARTLSYWV